MRRTIVPLLAGIGLLWACGCQPRPAPPPHSTYGETAHQWLGTGPSVAIIGDSLTVAAWDPLYRNLTTDHRVKIAAWFGEAFDGGALSTKLGGTWSTSVVNEYANDPPDVVVVALGTNTAWGTGDLDLAVANQAAALAAFPAACLVWVTLPLDPGATDWHTDRAAALNELGATWADHQVDWAGAVASTPTLLGADRVHTTTTGTAVRARLISEAVRACV